MQFIIYSCYNYLYVIIYSYNKLLFGRSFAQNIFVALSFFVFFCSSGVPGAQFENPLNVFLSCKNTVCQA